METDSLTVDPQEEALRDMGREVDMNEGRPVEAEAPPQEHEAPERETAETPEPEQAPETQEVAQTAAQRDESGRFTKGQQGRPDTEYSKAQKEQDRRDRSWQSLQAQKEEFRAQQAQWQENLRFQQLEAARRNTAPIKKDGLTAQEYFEGSQRLEAAGDPENALKAWKVALELHQAELQRNQYTQAANLEYNWRAQMERAIQVNPQIVQPGSKIMQLVDQMVAARPELYYMPDGFALAATVADMATRLEGYAALQDENDQLRAELEKRNRKGQPLDGRVTGGPRGEKSFDDMNLDEMESEMKRLTREADNY